jgi:hypothetical protein
MVDFAKILAERNRHEEWIATEVGAAFAKYENATIAYWRKDGDDRVSNRRLRELDDAMEKAKQEFLLLVRGW